MQYLEQIKPYSDVHKWSHCWLHQASKMMALLVLFRKLSFTLMFLKALFGTVDYDRGLMLAPVP